MCFSPLLHTHTHTHTHTKTYTVDNEVNKYLLSPENILYSVLSSLHNVIVTSYLLHVYQAFNPHKNESKPSGNAAAGHCSQPFPFPLSPLMLSTAVKWVPASSPSSDEAVEVRSEDEICPRPYQLQTVQLGFKHKQSGLGHVLSQVALAALS